MKTLQLRLLLRYVPVRACRAAEVEKTDMSITCSYCAPLEWPDWLSFLQGFGTFLLPAQAYGINDSYLL